MAAAVSSPAPEGQVRASIGTLMLVSRREFKSPLGHQLMHTAISGVHLRRAER